MKKNGARRRPSTGGKIFLAVVTCINLSLSLALALLRRAEVIHAVEGDEGVKVIMAAGRGPGKE